MKFIFTAITLVVAALFVPSYELKTLDNAFSDQYHTVESFWLFKDKCSERRKAAEFEDLRPICVRSTLWQSLRGTSSQYRREPDPAQLGI